ETGSLFLLTLSKLRRKLLVDLRTILEIGQLEKSKHDGPCDLFHLCVVDLLRLIARLVVVFMDAIEPKGDRNSIHRVIKMVRAKEETIRIFWIVVPRVVIQVEIALI